MEEPLESPFNVDTKFIEQNKNLNPKKTGKKGGPHTRNDRDKRMQEVYRLHFEYGYSARKIADLMNVNRNTVNGDIDYWYSKIYKNTNVFNPEIAIIINIERLERQRTRLREQLDKTDLFQEKLQLERLICEIDCKILQIYNRFTESVKRVHDKFIENLNDWMKENNRDERYMTFLDKIAVSKKAYEKINKIISEDRLGERK